MAQKDPITEALVLQAQWRKANACRQKWHERWSWLCDERKRAQEEARAIRLESAAITHLPVVKDAGDKTLKPVPQNSAGIVGWLSKRRDCQLEVYSSCRLKIPNRLPDTWETERYHIGES